MKYRGAVIFLGLIGLIHVAAAQQVTLESSLQQIDINQAFQLTVTVQDVDNPGAVEIMGMQAFTVHGQSTANNITMVNGVTHTQIQLQLQVQPTGTGSFVLGPARVQTASGVVESNAVTIDVVGEKLFVNPQSVVDLSGMTTSHAIPQEEGDDPNPGVLRRKRLIVVIVLAIGGSVFAYKKRISVLVRTMLFSKSSDIALEPAILKPVSLKLPRRNAPRFWDKLDQRTRQRLLVQGLPMTDGLTVQELLADAATYLTPEQHDHLRLVLDGIQQAKYAQQVGEEDVVLEYAKQLLASGKSVPGSR